jgi:protein-disulfide isomerase
LIQSKKNGKDPKQSMAGLVPNTGSSKGSDAAPVTIVEFSDFECPYCRKFADVMREVLPEEKDRVRIVFHHFPLPMHPWARLAAEGAACAQLQSSKSAYEKGMPVDQFTAKVRSAIERDIDTN